MQCTRFFLDENDTESQSSVESEADAEKFEVGRSIQVQVSIS